MKRFFFLVIVQIALGATRLLAIDANGDGMSDVWAEKYDVPSADADKDYSGNGLTNKDKSALGLNPLDPKARLSVEVTKTATATDFNLITYVIFGKTYQIENSVDRITWTPVAGSTSFEGADNIVTSTVTLATPPPAKIFFRNRYLNDVDTDGDGLTKWEERELGLNDTNSDWDNDGIHDGWEYSHGLNPKVADATPDLDGDNLSNLEEFELDTDPHTDSNVPGVSQGKLSAQPSGGSGYELPIVVSPGTAGIQPKLAFQYSSGGRNGPMGMGWSIAGISAVTRAPKTLAQDNAIRGVDMTINDRYALDGQRLMLIAGTEGTNGAEYRTEINSFTKVVAQGGTNGPATFTANTKSGLTYTFGGASGASFTAGRTDGTVLTWLISKVQDQAGNYMTFEYSAEGNITNVKYTMSGASGSYASVIFEYDATRPDTATGYVAGSSITMNQRLSRVTSYFGSQIVRRYKLKYDISVSTKKSRLISIREMATGGAFKPTDFTWSGAVENLALTPSVYAGGQQDHTHWIQGDFDGDGLADLTRARDNTLQVYKVATGSMVAAGSATSQQTFEDSDTWIQGDFSGDGKLDIMRVCSGIYTTLRLFTGTNGANAFSQSTPTVSGGTVTFQDWKLFVGMDANGDGKLDILCINRTNPNSNGSTALSLKVFLNNPTGTTPGAFVLQDWTPTGTDNCKKTDRWLVGDFNGDGLSDLVKVYKDSADKHSVRVYLNQNGSFSFVDWVVQRNKFFKNISPANTILAYHWISGDFNGDGLTDLASIPKPNNQESSTAVEVFLSTGSASTKFTIQTWLTPLTVSDNSDIQVGDYNVDGRADLVILRADDGGSNNYTIKRREFLSNGVALYEQGSETTDSITVVNSSSPPVLKRWFAADFNGDGKEDLIHNTSVVQSGQSKTYLNIYRSTPGFQDLLTKATDGLGSAASIDYQPLTGVNGIPVFVKSTDAAAPVIDLIVPMPVVASITYDDGRGTPGSSNYAVNYRYEGLKADPKRGMLGFRAVEAIDLRGVDNPNPSATPSSTPDTSVALHTKTWLRQGFPYTGMAERAASYLIAANSTKSFSALVDGQGAPVYSTGLLSLTTTTYIEGPTENPKVKYPYAQDSHTYSWDLNGAPTNDTQTIVPLVNDQHSVDAYGNTLQSIVKTKDLPSSSNFFIKTTTSQYATDTSTWRIGQVTGSSVEHQAPGEETKTRTSGFSYNSTNGQVGSETVEPSGANWVKTDYEYDAFGNTKKAITSGNDMSPAGTTRTTETTYDAQGRFLSTTVNALLHTETKQYDPRFGGVTSVTGPNGLTDTGQYDGFSRQILSTRADGAKTVTSYEWTNGGNAPANTVYLVRVTPDDGPQSVAYFDRLGRELRRQTVDGKSRTIFVDTTHDYRGRKKTVTKPYFTGGAQITATTLFDALDRVRQLQVPSKDENGNSVTTLITTNYNGLVISATNPKNQTTTTTKDAAGHMKEVKDALNATITYTYDAIGQLTRTVDAAGNATIIVYDIRGRKMSVDDPDLGLWTYDYYSTGELKWQKDAKNQQVNFQYDQLARVKRRDDPTGDYTIWIYDTAPGKGKGKLHSVAFTPATGSPLSPYSNTNSYDDFGRAISASTVITGNTYGASTVYDSFSRPTTLTYPSGFQVKNVYGTNGYLTDIKSPDGTKTYWTVDGTAGEYDAEGHITKETYGNGIITDRVYVPENGVLKEVHAAVGGGNTVQNLEYRFDVLGNLMKRSDNNQSITETFTYDSLNRLKTAQVTGQAQKTFSYDTIGAGTASLGNLAFKDGVGTYDYAPPTGSLQPGERPHPHAVRKVNGGTAATYDMNGNMTSGFGRTITWTWFNMPERIEGFGATREFTYDADHNRVKQRAVGANGLVETTYVGGFYERVSEGNFDYRKHYINSPTGRVAVFTEKVQVISMGGDPPPGTIVSSDTKFLHKDHLGSVDVVTSETGAVLERTSFDAWGFRRTTDWQGQQPLSYQSIVSRGFTDHEQLDDLGLVHMNGRIYDPGIGRFLSADPFVQAPMVTQNFNRYSYVMNNPLSFTDPSGFNIFGDIFNWMNDTFGSTGTQIIIGVAAIAVGFATAGAFTAIGGAIYGAALEGLSAAIVGGAGFGFGAGFSGTLFSGGSIGQAFQAGLIGGLIGGVSAGIAHGILGSFNPAGDFLTPGHLGQTAGHAALGGAIAEVQGDSFQSGALAAGLSALFAPGINKIGGGSMDIEWEAARVAASAAVGGTAAELGGGKFANGAVTAAFMRLYNEESAKWQPTTRYQRAIRMNKTAMELLREQAALVDSVAAANDVDPDLIRAIILHESRGFSLSSSRAEGQLSWIRSGYKGTFGYAQLGYEARLASNLTIAQAETMSGSIRGAGKWLAISAAQVRAATGVEPTIAQIASQYHSVRQLGFISNYGRQVNWTYDRVRSGQIGGFY